MQHRNHILTVALVVLWAGAAGAHETDQYSVPVGRNFAELGPYFSAGYRESIERAVATLNNQIRASLASGNPTAATAHYQDPATVASTVYHALPLWVTWVEPIESRLLTPELRLRYAGLLTVHQPPSWIYSHWALLLDPTKLPRLVRCGTVTINGVEVGTDKLMHFAHMGQYYVQTYFRAREAGRSVEQGMRAAVDLGTGPHPFLSEGTWLGLMSTGVWSNSDLAVNYTGMLFFRNLTETVRVQGELLPPMLVRDGEYWRLSDRMQTDRNFLDHFVSDHWNEVFNPNTYTLLMDGFVRDAIRSRCADATEWYTDRNLHIRSRADFLQRMVELSTYYGEDYGYRGNPAELVSIVTTCPLPDVVPAETGCPVEDRAEPCDALGRSALWWAAADGDGERVDALLAGGADANAADVDGEMPLHAAARANRGQIITRLAQAGADVNARALYATTPLHVAARAGATEAVQALLSAGADPRAADAFEVTPLEDAAVNGHAAAAQLLVETGADTKLLRRGTTLAERMRRAGAGGLVDRITERKAAP